jgi:GTP-binding protein HflX
VRCVVAGEPEEITIPALSRFRALPSRLRGLRFVRTSAGKAEPDSDDIADLALLRLDTLSVLTGNVDGVINSLCTIHLMPPQPDRSDILIPYAVLSNTNPHQSPFDFRNFVEELEYEISSKTKALYVTKKKYAAILVGVFTSREGVKERMAELSELAQSAEADVLDIITQIRADIHPRTVLGAGKLKEIMITALVKGADIIIFDNSLSPAQVKEISGLADINIIDRTQLILDIFAKRAVSNEGKIRVELARLKYYLPYLTLRDDAMSRITGGIDGRGPGETKMEIDRRRIADRISFLTGKLKKIERNRVTQRSKRVRHKLPVISIIGYTNAGKTTLLNTLTQSDAYADDRMFATLDTSSKRIRFPRERDVIITDTVGFIRDLPEDLAGAFKSSLEELYEADVLLHIADASSPYAGQHIKSVRTVLNELGIADKPTILAFNKTDLIEKNALEMLRADQPNAEFISAKDKKSLKGMINSLDYIISRNIEHFP